MSNDNKYPESVSYTGNITDVNSTFIGNVSGSISTHADTSGYERKPMYKEIEDFTKNIENRLKESKTTISVYERTLGNLRSFSFKEGDIIISRSQGNGIVCGVEENAYAYINENFPDKLYIVIATKNGYIKVLPEDIMPYTIASKVLYERS